MGIIYRKQIDIEIGYKDLCDIEDKRKKPKLLIITNTKGKNLNGDCSRAGATITIDERVIVVDPEWMMEAMKKIIDLKNI